MDRFAARLAIRAAAYFAALIMVLCGLGYLCFAAYLALLERVSPPMAALIAAGAAFIIAGVLILAGRLIASSLRRRQRRDADKLAAAFGALLGDEIVSLATENPNATLFTSLFTGFAVGAFPEFRHVLRELLRKSS